MSKKYVAESFFGINNRVPSHRLPVGAMADAINIDILDDGTFETRPGKRVISVVSDGHSLYSVAGRMLLAVEDTLREVEQVEPFTTRLLASGLSGGRVSYVDVNGEAWWSNGTQSGRIQADGNNRPWCIPKPAAPTLQAVSGTLPAGKYQVAIAHMSATLEESAPSLISTIELATAGGVQAILPSAPAGVASTKVFITACNGSALFRHSVVASSTASVSITTAPNAGEAVGDRFLLEATPPGQLLSIFNGCLLSAQGGVLYISEPYRFGYHNPIKGRIPFPEPITVIAPVDTGIFVVADKTYWISGRDLSQAEALPKSGLRAVFGSALTIAEGRTVAWFSEKGVVVGEQDGSVRLLTNEAFSAPKAQSAYAMVRRESGNVHLLFSFDDSASYTAEADSGFLSRLSKYNADASTVCVNWAEGYVTRYTGHKARGYAEKDGRFYMVDATAFCHLDPDSDKDNLTPVSWAADLGKLRFDSDHLKRIPVAYVAFSAASAPTLDIETSDGAWAYPARATSAALTVQRFDIGKGLRATWFGIVLRGTKAKVSSIDLTPAESARRI